MQSTTRWRVLDEDAGVVVAEYSFAKGAVANTFVARMANGELMVVSPSVELSDADAAELEAFGPVGAIVANNGLHYLGQATWRQRYPHARCFASEQAIARIQSKSPVPLPFEPLSALAELTGPDIGIRDVPNTKTGESWCWVSTTLGHVWFVSDVIANLPQLPAAWVPKALFWATGSAPGLRVFHLGLRFMVNDKVATLRLLRDDVQSHPPVVVVPAHGDLLVGDDVDGRLKAVLTHAIGA